MGWRQILRDRETRPSFSPTYADLRKRLNTSIFPIKMFALEKHLSSFPFFKVYRSMMPTSYQDWWQEIIRGNSNLWRRERHDRTDIAEINQNLWEWISQTGINKQSSCLAAVSPSMVPSDLKHEYAITLIISVSIYPMHNWKRQQRWIFLHRWDSL